MESKNLDNEIIVGLHFIRKSSSSLVEDLKYFSDLSNHFSIEQIANVLGQIEEVEQNIKSVRDIFSKKVNS